MLTRPRDSRRRLAARGPVPLRVSLAAMPRAQERNGRTRRRRTGGFAGCPWGPMEPSVNVG